MSAPRRSQTSLVSTNTPPSPSSPSSPPLPSSSSSSWINLRLVLLTVASSSSSSSPVSSKRGSLKFPWSRRRRKRALLAKQWKALFDADGKLSDGGVEFLKKVRTAGVEPHIRADVWPFLLGMYDVRSTKRERSSIRAQKRRDYLELRRQCREISKRGGKSFKLKVMSGNNSNELSLDDVSSDRPSGEDVDKDGSKSYLKQEAGDFSEAETGSLYSCVSEDLDDAKPLLSPAETKDDHVNKPDIGSTLNKSETMPTFYRNEDFATWQRIIRLDAVRANPEWVDYSPSEAAVSEGKARQLAKSVGLKDSENLEPCRLYHAARLVAILEAYAVYDPEIGYCQGMSDLLSPIVSVIEEDHVAFWCFVSFMCKARHNFRLDEVGIRRQLNVVSKIIRCKDSRLYQHLEKLQAEDCFFVYRMVVVLFRRELTFEQTLSLWEVMWADQAAIRAGIVKSSRRRLRVRAPPTDDLLLYTIAACVLQRKKLIMENYSSMDEIMKESSSIAGHLDVWKLLDDAHDLVVTLHDKI